MEMPLKVIANTGDSCGGCSSSSCGTCSPAPSGNEAETKLTRRELGRAALAASAGAFLFGCSLSHPQAAAEENLHDDQVLSPELDVVRKGKGPIMTVLDEFYKMGPGPSSSHTMGPMRITYDFFQRISKLPEDQLKRATALKVHLFGSLSV